MAQQNDMNRRTFVSNSSKLLAASALLPLQRLWSATAKRKIRLALVGTGSRGTTMWGKNLVHPYKDYVEMVGLCDINPKRLQAGKNWIGVEAPTYTADEFDRMVKETKPDAVIVTTPDCFHEKYIVRTLELGVDVISEKAVATEAAQCQRIMDAEKNSGRNVLVTFNVRYMQDSEEMKIIIASGVLGNIISVEFQEYLDVHHGAQYFRRWHGKKAYSGSLLVHKASHHFDLVNWLLESEPAKVQAMGRLAVYGKNHDFRGRNCRTCSFQKKCDFYWDMTGDKRLMSLYAACEDVDGYYRDGCVWDNDIDSYDTSSVHVEYESGTELTYSMNAFLPYEGQYMCFIGDKGRLDVRKYSRQPWEAPAATEIRLSINRGESKLIELPPRNGGAYEKLKDMFFRPGQKDELGQLAGSRAGIMSSLIGIAARHSIETGEKIAIPNLIDLPPRWKWNSPTLKS